MSDSVWLDNRSPKQAGLPQSVAPNPPSSEAIEEAQGWIKQPDGSIHLVANYPSGIPPAVHSPCVVRSK
ncbi:hypothetical protein IQ250_17595 [Pseudanabaenaceae cyanobacterium LEGE 13415]|nr:hypothetical protein [Pseudanabaenaceae cyanobacterium LEGE 13415]